MRRRGNLVVWAGLGCGWLVGCTATDPAGSGPMPARWGEPVPVRESSAPVAAASNVANKDGNAARLATAGDATAATTTAATTTAGGAPQAPLEVELLAAARELASAEQYEAALSLLEPLAARGTAPAVAVARAGLLRDLGRRGEALVALRNLIAAVGALAVHPGLLFELAELAWLEQRPDEAAAVLRNLVQGHGDHAWLVEHRAEVVGLQQELARGGAPQRLRVRDLLADLRGSADPERRRWCLQRLLAVAGEAETETTAELRARAVAIAAGDSAAGLRALALRHAEIHPDELQALCAAGGADPEPLVRLAALQRSRHLPAALAVPLWWSWCQQESDGDVFVAIHAALAGCHDDAPSLPADASESVAARAAVLQAWRQRLAPSSPPSSSSGR